MANPLDAFKKLPTWGKVAVIGGGVGVTWFAWKQHTAAQAASSSSTNPSATDPLTGLPYSEDNTTDPITGMTYLAEAQQYGSVSAAESAYASGTTGQYYNSGYGSTGTLGSYGYVGNSTTSETYTTNAQWAQAVEAGLTDIGYSSTDVAGAIGYYLSGVPLTSTQATIVYDAIAEFGQPPTGAPSITLTGSSTATTGNTSTSTGSTSTGSTSTGSTSSSGSSTSSGSTGSTSSGSTTTTQTSTVSGGHVVSVNNNDAVIAWSHSGPATSWKVTRSGPGGTVSNTVGIPQASYSGLSAGHTYDVYVQPLPSGQGGNITFKTT